MHRILYARGMMVTSGENSSLHDKVAVLAHKPLMERAMGERLVNKGEREIGQ
jgi:hypothetical protein